MKQTAITHEFVTEFPDDPADGTIYISIPFASALHRCCCGCANRVITPLAPNRWTLTFDGRTISLHPSIGNWSFPCQSHYFIRRNKVEWARRWTREEITAAREQDATETTPRKRSWRRWF